MNKISVLLADDQTILRDGLKSLLQFRMDIDVVGCACNGEEAVGLADTLNPDVILMDIRMPVMDGVEATKKIKAAHPDRTIIMLTTFDDDEYVIKAMAYGASGYLLKDMGSEQLVQAIRDGKDGNIILPGRIASKIASKLAQSQTGKPAAQAGDFSDREKDVIALMVSGKTNGEIAQALYLTVGTVKNYVSQIYMKLNARDRTNAVLMLKKIGF